MQSPSSTPTVSDELRRHDKTANNNVNISTPSGNNAVKIYNPIRNDKAIPLRKGTQWIPSSSLKQESTSDNNKINVICNTVLRKILDSEPQYSIINKYTTDHIDISSTPENESQKIPTINDDSHSGDRIYNNNNTIHRNGMFYNTNHSLVHISDDRNIPAPLPIEVNMNDKHGNITTIKVGHKNDTNIPTEEDDKEFIMQYHVVASTVCNTSYTRSTSASTYNDNTSVNKHAADIDSSFNRDASKISNQNDAKPNNLVPNIIDIGNTPRIEEATLLNKCGNDTSPVDYNGNANNNVIVHSYYMSLQQSSSTWTKTRKDKIEYSTEYANTEDKYTVSRTNRCIQYSTDMCLLHELIRNKEEYLTILNDVDANPPPRDPRTACTSVVDPLPSKANDYGVVSHIHLLCLDKQVPSNNKIVIRDANTTTCPASYLDKYSAATSTTAKDNKTNIVTTSISNKIFQTPLTSPVDKTLFSMNKILGFTNEEHGSIGLNIGRRINSHPNTTPKLSPSIIHTVCKTSNTCRTSKQLTTMDFIKHNNITILSTTYSCDYTICITSKQKKKESRISVSDTTKTVKLYNMDDLNETSNTDEQKYNNAYTYGNNISKCNGGIYLLHENS